MDWQQPTLTTGMEEDHTPGAWPDDFEWMLYPPPRSSPLSLSWLPEPEPEPEPEPLLPLSRSRSSERVLELMSLLRSREREWQEQRRELEREQVLRSELELPQLQSPPLDILSALAETGQDELTIPVLKQRSFTGKGIIPSALADTPCAALGVRRVLKELKRILDPKILSPKMFPLLKSYIEQGYDFGLAYAYLRCYRNHSNTIEDWWHVYEENDLKRRRRAIVDDKIITRDIPPRRMWDLYANRVVPYWVARKGWHAISHAWVDVKERIDVWTPINRYEWPVPMPKDADLKLIRIEMLNLGAEYVWLDVLCLRQEYMIGKGYHNEELRRMEWSLDVPTIGYVYDKHTVVCYLSGLGRPLSFKKGDFESDRCWFNRAWTLQEIPNGSDPLIGGDTDDDGFMEEKMRMRVHEKLESLCRMRSFNTIFDIMLLMRNRVSTKPLDKVAGLTYLFNADSIPIYNEAQSEEDAWMALVDAMQSSRRAQLFFYYPGPGNGNRSWRPSWEQALAYTLPWCDRELNTGFVHRIKRTDSEWYNGPRIDTIYVYGLADPSDNPRQGKLSFEENMRGSCACKIIADHTYPIPDGWYTIISISKDSILSGCIWVVGQLRYDRKFEKVSVIRLADNEEKLKHWGLGVERHVHTVLC